MPLYDVSNACSFYYELQPAHRRLRPDPSAPTLMILSPLGLDVSVLAPITTSAAAQGFNVLSVDVRGHGRTTSTASALADQWTQAAELASLLQALELPPVHVVCGANVAGQVGTTLTILFPEAVASLSFAAVCTIAKPMEHVEIWREVIGSLDFAEDPEELLDAVKACVDGITNDAVSPAVMAELLRIWKRNYPQKTCTRSFDSWDWTMIEHTVTPAHMASIKRPVLIMHGTGDRSVPVADAKWLRDCLTYSSAIEYHIIPDAPNALLYTHQAEVQELLFPFVQRHSRVARPAPVAFDFRASLARFANLSSTPNLASRNANDAMSFSLVSPQVAASRSEYLGRLRAREARPLPTLYPDQLPDRQSTHLPLPMREVSIDRSTAHRISISIEEWQEVTAPIIPRQRVKSCSYPGQPRGSIMLEPDAMGDTGAFADLKSNL